MSGIPRCSKRVSRPRREPFCGRARSPCPTPIPLPVRRPRRRTSYDASRPDTFRSPSRGTAVKPAQHRGAAPKAGLRAVPLLGILLFGRVTCLQSWRLRSSLTGLSPGTHPGGILAPQLSSRLAVAVKKSELYPSLWQSCDELRGGMDASQYKDYVLFRLFREIRQRPLRRPAFGRHHGPRGAHASLIWSS